MISQALHSALSSLPRLDCGLPLSSSRFFEPNDRFLKLMEPYRHLRIFGVGAGVGHVSKLLHSAMFKVTALDLYPRTKTEFPVTLENAVRYPYQAESLLLFCRPSHGGFVEASIVQGQRCGVQHFVYAGLAKNVKEDLGDFRRHFHIAGRGVGVEAENFYFWGHV